MRDKRKASAQRVDGGFQVRVPRPQTGEYELFVHDTGAIEGLTGTRADVVIIMLVSVEIDAEGWPSLATRILRRYNLF